MQAFILLSRLFFHHFEFRLKSRFYRMTEKSNIRLLGPKFFNRRVTFSTLKLSADQPILNSALRFLRRMKQHFKNFLVQLFSWLHLNGDKTMTVDLWWGIGYLHHSKVKPDSSPFSLEVYNGESLSPMVSFGMTNNGVNQTLCIFWCNAPPRKGSSQNDLPDSIKPLRYNFQKIREIEKHVKDYFLEANRQIQRLGHSAGQRDWSF